MTRTYEPLLKGRISTFDLVVLTRLDQLLSIFQTLFTFLQKQATIIRRSTLLSLSLQLAFLAETNTLAYLLICDQQETFRLILTCSPELSCVGVDVSASSMFKTSAKSLARILLELMFETCKDFDTMYSCLHTYIHTYIHVVIKPEFSKFPKKI